MPEDNSKHLKRNNLIQSFPLKKPLSQKAAFSRPIFSLN
jgi:hypothetical protein